MVNLVCFLVRPAQFGFGGIGLQDLEKVQARSLSFGHDGFGHQGFGLGGNVELSRAFAKGEKDLFESGLCESSNEA